LGDDANSTATRGRKTAPQSKKNNPPTAMGGVGAPPKVQANRNRGHSPPKNHPRVTQRKNCRGLKKARPGKKNKKKTTLSPQTPQKGGVGATRLVGQKVPHKRKQTTTTPHHTNQTNEQKKTHPTPQPPGAKKIYGPPPHLGAAFWCSQFALP